MRETEEIIIERQNVIFDQKILGGQEMPEQFVLTKGLQKGELLIFSAEEWSKFSEWFDFLPQNESSNRRLRRFFRLHATIVEPKEREQDGDIVYELPLRIQFFEWLGGFEGKDNYLITYVERYADSWAACWELKQIRRDDKKSEYDFAISPVQLYIEALFSQAKVDAVGNSRLAFEDGTVADIFLNEGGNEENAFRIKKLNGTDSAISDVRVLVEDDDNERRTWKIEAETETGDIVTILDVEGPDNEYGDGFMFKVKYKGEPSFSNRVRYLFRKEVRERILKEE